MNFAQLLVLDPSSFRRRPVLPYDNIKYGLLYNWYATQEQGTGVWLVGDDMRSEGWDVPTYNDFIELILNIEPDTSSADFYRTNTVGKKLKETGTTYWQEDNSEGNIYYYSLRAGGARSDTGTLQLFRQIGSLQTSTQIGSLQTSTQIISTQNWAFNGRYNFDNLNPFGIVKKSGISIRLVRPATTAEQALPDGELSGVYYYGNDEKVYRTTKIGTQVWVADNLAETKWSNGNYIFGWSEGGLVEISDVDWAARTEAAVCVYGNQIGNM